MTIRELLDKYASESTAALRGWIRSIRVSKNVGFIMLNDGSTFQNVQIVFEQIHNFDEISRVNVGASIEVNGNIVLTPGGQQPFEINATAITLLGASTPDYPLQNKRHSFEYLRSIAHLRPRSNTFSAVFRIRHAASMALHNFFDENGFTFVHTPVITANDGEGAGALFTVTTQADEFTATGKADWDADYFGKRTYLTVTGQLEAEALAMAFGKVYTFGPTFRAENSNTVRHASEFIMIEPEMAFADLQENMRVSQAMTKALINGVLQRCPNEMDFLNERIDKTLLERLQAVASADFGHITYTDAIAEMEKVNDQFEYKAKWGIDLQTEHERFISEQLFGKPVFVTDYPAEFKSFYMRQNEDGKTVAAMDMLVPYVGELIGGSQREERYDRLVHRMNELGMHTEPLQWYLDLRKYGGCVHSGFGIGFERAMMYLTGIQNIRDVSIFPRTVGTCEY